MRFCFLKRLLEPFKYFLTGNHALFFALVLVFGCAGKPPVTAPLPPPKANIYHVRYTIQAGAFSTVENAIRLTKSLENQKLDAYYYRHSSGLFKVRFGDFASKKQALSRAKFLVAAGILDAYYIVPPDEYRVRSLKSFSTDALRTDLVRTAESFIGIPYQWGGTSPDEGFDCSGLVMAVYQLNGFKLPRSSYQQFSAGTPVNRKDLKRGDLVFFADSRKARVSHVGMYVGNNTFVHAPSKGKTIRKTSLTNTYFAPRFVGCRTYLR